MYTQGGDVDDRDAVGCFQVANHGAPADIGGAPTGLSKYS